MQGTPRVLDSSVVSGHKTEHLPAVCSSNRHLQLLYYSSVYMGLPDVVTSGMAIHLEDSLDPIDRTVHCHAILWCMYASHESIKY